MSTAAEAFTQRVSRLKADLVEQGRRVEAMVEASIDALFDRDAAKAQWVIERDNVIDKADVEIERAAVQLLTDAARESVALDPSDIRGVLTIVKVNNEIERVADGAVTISEQTQAIGEFEAAPPGRFRVMANSVIGILRDSVASFDQGDIALAETVLASDDTVDEFERRILKDMQEAVAQGKASVDFAFAINIVAAELERMGDHCTNIAEQVIYLATGKIVRHMEGHWTAPEEPP